jgi:hypothetical protein
MDMLYTAMDAAEAKGLEILWLCQDMCRMDMYGSFAAVLCMTDGVNHITTRKRLDAFFKRIYNFVDEGGLLIFDFLTPYHFESRVGKGGNVFYEDGEEGTCLWTSCYNEKSGICRYDITVYHRCDIDDNEDAEELCKYFVYVAGVLAAILILEVLHLYVAYDDVIVNGTIKKGAIDFGWGISNTCGNCLTVLVPICFLGVIKSKYHYVYFTLATLSYVAAVLTLCRNAVLFGSMFYIACVILCCIFGERKKTYRFVAIGILAFLIVLELLFSKQVQTLFANMIAHGLDDNGRYPLWKAAFDGFLEHPIFGNGFHSFVPEVSRYASFIPFLAHNTVLELAYSMGAFGLVAYGIYRIYTLIPFVKKLSIEKVFLFLSIATLIVESLIDNYIFWFAPTFVYNLAIIIAIKYNESEKTPLTENVKAEE